MCHNVWKAMGDHLEIATTSKLSKNSQILYENKITLQWNRKWRWPIVLWKPWLQIAVGRKGEQWLLKDKVSWRQDRWTPLPQDPFQVVLHDLWMFGCVSGPTSGKLVNDCGPPRRETQKRREKGGQSEQDHAPGPLTALHYSMWFAVKTEGLVEFCVFLSK